MPRKKKITDSITNTNANMESNTSYASNESKDVKGFPTPCRIHFHHIRKRLADYDGISTKAIQDGLVHAKILPDDSPKYIKEVSHTQEKGEPELTIITLTEI